VQRVDVENFNGESSNRAFLTPGSGLSSSMCRRIAQDSVQSTTNFIRRELVENIGEWRKGWGVRQHL
jgi:hypothetical protein